MSLDGDIRLLSRVRMFEGFDHDHLRLLAFGAEARSIPQGMRLYKQGVYSDGGYVVSTGSLDLVSGPNDTLISSHGPASLVGEMALISANDHAATAIAAEDCDVLKIPRSLFHRMLEEYPELAVMLEERISKSVNAFVAELERIGEKLDRANEQAHQKASEASA